MSIPGEQNTRPSPQPGDQVIGLSPEQLAAIHDHKDNGGANPSEVVEAFTSAPQLMPEGITVHSVTLGHFLFLEKIKSPLADSGKGSQDFTNLETLSAIYVLTRPAKASREVFGKGIWAFEEEVNEFADGIPFGRLPALVAAVKQAMAEAFATIIPDEKKTETGETTPPANLPASAGG